MPTYNINPTSDGTNGYDTNTYLNAGYTNSVSPPLPNRSMHLLFDTSGIGSGETITAVTFYANFYSYIYPKGSTPYYYIFHVDISGGVPAFTLANFGVWSRSMATVRSSFSLSSVGVWDISTGNNQIRVFANSVAGADTSMFARSSEYATSSMRPYIEVTTAAAGGGTKTYVIMAG